MGQGAEQVSGDEQVPGRVAAPTPNGYDLGSCTMTQLASDVSDMFDALSDARAEIDRLRHGWLLLGPARSLLDKVAEELRPAKILRPAFQKQIEEVAQRIVDEIGHPPTDEPALGPSMRELLAEAAKIISQVRPGGLAAPCPDPMPWLDRYDGMLRQDAQPQAFGLTPAPIAARDAPPLAAMVGAIPDLTGGLSPSDYLEAVRSGSEADVDPDGICGQPSPPPPASSPQDTGPCIRRPHQGGHRTAYGRQWTEQAAEPEPIEDVASAVRDAMQEAMADHLTSLTLGYTREDVESGIEAALHAWEEAPDDTRILNLRIRMVEAVLGSLVARERLAPPGAVLRMVGPDAFEVRRYQNAPEQRGGLTERERWLADQAALMRGREAQADAAEKACDEQRPALVGWHGALHDALSELRRVIEWDHHPDTTAAAGAAINRILGVWLDADETGRVWWEAVHPDEPYPADSFGAAVDAPASTPPQQVRVIDGPIKLLSVGLVSDGKGGIVAESVVKLPDGRQVTVPGRLVEVVPAQPDAAQP